MDDATALVLADSIDDCLEAADGLGLEELRELVGRKLAEQRVAPEVLAAWRLVDEERAKEALAATGQRRYDGGMDAVESFAPTTRPRTAAGDAATRAADALHEMRQSRVGARDYQRALDLFVESQKGLCARMVRKFTGDDVDREDLKQAAIVGLLVAVMKWEPGRGATFSSWASWAIRDALRAELKTSHLVVGKRSHGRPVERLVCVEFKEEGVGG